MARLATLMALLLGGEDWVQGNASRLAIVEMIEAIVLQLSCRPWSEAGATMEVLCVENQGNW